MINLKADIYDTQEAKMTYFIQIQKGIDYIEKNLKNNISTATISSVCGYSVPHLYRVFKAMTGYTVMEYVRKRRLSEAFIDLLTTPKNILEIAVEYGYESHEAFTRAFKSTYASSPSKLRSLDEVNLFEKINLLSNTIKGDLIMKPEIIFKDKMTLLCAKQFVSGSVNEKFGLFRTTRESLIKSIDCVENRLGDKYIATYDFNNDDILKPHEDIEYTYYFGIEITSTSTALQGLVKKDIAPAKYAVFTYDKTTKTLNGERLDRTIYDYINGIWLPNSGYVLSEAEDLEIIDLENNTVQYFISILEETVS